MTFPDFTSHFIDLTASQPVKSIATEAVDFRIRMGVSDYEDVVDPLFNAMYHQMSGTVELTFPERYELPGQTLTIGFDRFDRDSMLFGIHDSEGVGWLSIISTGRVPGEPGDGNWDDYEGLHGFGAHPNTAIDEAFERVAEELDELGLSIPIAAPDVFRGQGEGELLVSFRVRPMTPSHMREAAYSMGLAFLCIMEHEPFPWSAFDEAGEQLPDV